MAEPIVRQAGIHNMQFGHNVTVIEPVNLSFLTINYIFCLSIGISLDGGNPKKRVYSRLN